MHMLDDHIDSWTHLEQQVQPREHPSPTCSDESKGTLFVDFDGTDDAQISYRRTTIVRQVDDQGSHIDVRARQLYYDIAEDESGLYDRPYAASSPNVPHATPRSSNTGPPVPTHDEASRELPHPLHPTSRPPLPLSPPFPLHGTDPTTRWRYSYNEHTQILHVHASPTASSSGLSEYFELDASQYRGDEEVGLQDVEDERKGLRESKRDRVLKFVERFLKAWVERWRVGKRAKGEKRGGAVDWGYVP